MRGIPSSFLLLFLSIIILIELLSYSGIRLLIKESREGIRRLLTVSYILLSIAASGLIIYSYSNPELIKHTQNYSLFYFVIVVSFLNLIPKSFFAFMTLISWALRWLSGKWAQLLIISGSFLLSTGVFVLISYGHFWGRYSIIKIQQDLYFDKLPQQLEGLKIVQLSDIHLGSFNKNPKVLQETVSIINMIKPDILLFTGDMVNNFADEMEGFQPYFRGLSARYGKFAIQGNHDYGDYSSWPDSTAKQINLNKIRDGFVQSGFKLLLNEWKNIEVQDTSFALIGVENWGHPPFPQYAKLDQAMVGIPDNIFRILMSHDPAHWGSIVVPETDIPLTLAGHTHGAQFGIKIAGIEFSPIYIIQKNWGGLYKSDNQLLYVNRGLGTIGFQGRIDMRPEITILTLHRSKSH
jgi:uncharacterized protein